jgi:hypothetical protein
MPMD